MKELGDNFPIPYQSIIPYHMCVLN
ncbi:hypothetical protein BN873_270090 [Candidatus Competibacter denitrificans Run_A_D11]|uniref:Uncharacterized protein n=1 Tax=Candidatus Competibacter denitrificans Run_A_D11 TaxID=1400863 RepID=W6M6P6_9GAMM|nr:hypothetical protein BN873_270090 [Candidatus Competibacter denitrificans Run_A_D11]